MTNNAAFKTRTEASEPPHDQTKVVKSLYRWVQKNIQYDVLDSLNPVSSYCHEDTIKRGSGNCVAISGVFMALLREEGIECRFRLLHVRPRNTSFTTTLILMGRTDFPHGIVEVRINHRWVPMLPIAGLRFLPSTGHTVLDLKESDGEPKFILIQDLGSHPDIPELEIEALGAHLHPHLHGKGRWLRALLARLLTKPRLN